MILDSSAIVAILHDEPDAELYSAAIDRASVRSISAANFVELAAVVESSRDPITGRRLDEFMAAAGIVIEPVTERQAHIARAAYRDFGRGSGHPARLNFGDCFAYALAKEKGEPLLFKGDDFAQTDVAPALR